MPLRLAFMGTPDFAVPTLSELVAQGHDIAAVFSQPPRPAGRGQKERPSAVAQAAEQFGLEIRTPKTLKTEEAQSAFRALELDAAVVIAYGLILPAAILEAPRLGCINLHASLLPRWRGAAPINRAIMAGDTETGVCAMQMDEGLDTGPVLMCEQVPIGPNMTAGELHDELAGLGASVIIRALSALERGSIAARPQSDLGVTYAAKIEKAEGRIDWSNTATAIDRQIRGLTPFPGAFFEAPDRKGALRRIRVLEARPVEDQGSAGIVLDADGLRIACGEGALDILRLQREGAAPADARAFLNGFPLPPGTRLGDV